MALKRVSDLENRKYSDIQQNIEKIYNSSDINKNKLLKSKIEVSEVIDDDESCSLFQSYAYDVHALSGLFNDGVVNRPITLFGNKTFNDNVTINGDFSLSSSSVLEYAPNAYIKTRLFDVSSTDLSINTSNSLFFGSEGTCNVNVNELSISVDDDTSIISNKTITLTGKNVVINFTESFHINMINDGNSQPIFSITNSGNNPSVIFPQNQNNTNPIDGCINKAMWS